MTGPEPGLQYLIMLRGELASRGVRCELRDDGGQVRLHVGSPGQGTAGEPGGTVVVSRISGQWWYCWRQALPVSPVTPLTRAAEAVISDLGLDRDGGAGGGGQVAPLRVRRMLRQARLEISRPLPPGAAAGGPAPARQLAPGSAGGHAPW